MPFSGQLPLDEAALAEGAKQREEHAGDLIRQAEDNETRIRWLIDEAQELTLEAHVLRLAASTLPRFPAPSRSIEPPAPAASKEQPALQDYPSGE